MTNEECIHYSCYPFGDDEYMPYCHLMSIRCLMEDGYECDSCEGEE